MSENPRIEELRRRVEQDPASIAFAQLAEEHRRAGSYDEAVAACRGGLAIHPGYLSARVTLGRALIETHQLDAAEVELGHVLDARPENLAAIRGLAEIHRRRGNLEKALGLYRNALTLANQDPALEQAVEDITRAIGPADDAVRVTRPVAPAVAAFPQPGQPPVLPELERFLGAIHTYRQRRAV